MSEWEQYESGDYIPIERWGHDHAICALDRVETTL